MPRSSHVIVRFTFALCTAIARFADKNLYGSGTKPQCKLAATNAKFTRSSQRCFLTGNQGSTNLML